MRRWVLGLIVSLSTGQLAVPAMSGAVERDTLRCAFERLQTEGNWVRARLPSGRRIVLRVERVDGDSVVVRERVGPLYRHLAVYPLSELAEWTPVDASREATYPETRSLLAALAMESVLPGAGYVYTGDTRTAVLLMGLATVAGGTALATGEGGAAGWVPAMVWLKVASLVQLTDQVRAINGRDVRGGRGSGGGPAVSPGHFLRDCSVRAGQTQGPWAPGVRVSVRF